MDAQTLATGLVLAELYKFGIALGICAVIMLFVMVALWFDGRGR